jgi:hypothetical protein
MHPLGQPEGHAHQEVLDWQSTGLPTAELKTVVSAMHGLGPTGPCGLETRVSHFARGSRVCLAVRVREVWKRPADDSFEFASASDQRRFELAVVEPGEDLVVERVEPNDHAGAGQGLDVRTTELTMNVHALGLGLEDPLQRGIVLAG